MEAGTGTIGPEVVQHGPVHDSDVCHTCGTRVVDRDWYVLGHNGLDDTGHCVSCGAAIPGVFEGPAGTSGARRQPIQMRGRPDPQGVVPQIKAGGWSIGRWP